MTRKLTPREQLQATHDARFKIAPKRRASMGEIERMICRTCGERPQYELSPYAFSQGDKYTYYVCNCRGRGQWIEIVGKAKS